HGNAVLPEALVVLRSGQRGQAEEFDKIERQLLLDDADIAPDRLGSVLGKTKDISCERHDALRLPRQQHLPVFGDLVLTLLRRDKIIRVDVLQSNEDARDTGTLGLLDEIWYLVTQRVDLDHQPKRNLVLLAQLGQAIKDRHPISVALNDRGDRGDVGIIRSPVRASILPDRIVGEREKLSSVMKNLLIPCAQLIRTRCSTSSAER